MPGERVEGLVRSLLWLSAGALVVSLYLFLGPDALQIGEDLVAALQISWALLFYALVAGVLVQFFAVSQLAARIARFILVTALAALVAGLALLALVCLVAVSDLNAPDQGDDQPVHAALDLSR